MMGPVLCVHDVGLVSNLTLWLAEPEGKLKSTVAPRSTVTLLSAGSLLEASWNQFLTGDAVS